MVTFLQQCHLSLDGHCYSLAFTWMIGDAPIPGQWGISSNKIQMRETVNAVRTWQCAYNSTRVGTQKLSSRDASDIPNPSD